MAGPSFSVNAKTEAKTRVRVKAPQSRFEFVVDKPVAAGGTNQGPNPVEYLLGALAGCVGITANQAAEELDINLDGVAIQIAAVLDDAAANGEQPMPITIRVKAESDADADALRQWRSLVEKNCTIHHILERGARIAWEE